MVSDFHTRHKVVIPAHSFYGLESIMWVGLATDTLPCPSIAPST